MCIVLVLFLTQISIFSAVVHHTLHECAMDQHLVFATWIALALLCWLSVCALRRASRNKKASPCCYRPALTSCWRRSLLCLGGTPWATCSPNRMRCISQGLLAHSEDLSPQHMTFLHGPTRMKILFFVNAAGPCGSGVKKHIFTWSIMTECVLMFHGLLHWKVSVNTVPSAFMFHPTLIQVCIFTDTFLHNGSSRSSLVFREIYGTTWHKNTPMNLASLGEVTQVLLFSCGC